MKGLILTNAHTHYEELDYQPKRLKEEFNNLGVDVDIKDNLIPVYIDSSCVLNLNLYDFCVYLDKDIPTLLALEKAGLKCFNNSKSIITCDSKALTSIALAGEGILMPKTIIGNKIYNTKESIKDEYIEKIEQSLSYPFVMKVTQSSQGMGVYLIQNRSELINKITENQEKEILFQEYISNSYGKDIRVIVIGGRVIGAMLRENKDDFRSNLSSGGNSCCYKIDENLEAVAQKIATILDLDYAGLDFLIDNDKYYLCEVNSNAFFKGFEKTTNINVANIFAKHILSNLD